ncbi:MAG: hypothetical protein ACLPWS_05600, partial [Rhodomicrobium sp.]
DGLSHDEAASATQAGRDRVPIAVDSDRVKPRQSVSNPSHFLWGLFVDMTLKFLNEFERP